MSTSLFHTFTGMMSSAFDFNKATLSGALDIIAVKDDQGNVTTTPFHVRFGKFKVLRSREKRVAIRVNGELVDIEMKLSNEGQAFFLQPKGPCLFDAWDDDEDATPCGEQGSLSSPAGSSVTAAPTGSVTSLPGATPTAGSDAGGGTSSAELGVPLPQVGAEGLDGRGGASAVRAAAGGDASSFSDGVGGGAERESDDEPGTEPDTEPGTETGTETGTDPARQDSVGGDSGSDDDSSPGRKSKKLLVVGVTVDGESRKDWEAEGRHTAGASDAGSAAATGRERSDSVSVETQRKAAEAVARSLIENDLVGKRGAATLVVDGGPGESNVPTNAVAYLVPNYDHDAADRTLLEAASVSAYGEPVEASSDPEDLTSLRLPLRRRHRHRHHHRRHKHRPHRNHHHSSESADNETSGTARGGIGDPDVSGAAGTGNRPRSMTTDDPRQDPLAGLRSSAFTAASSSPKEDDTRPPTLPSLSSGHDGAIDSGLRSEASAEASAKVTSETGRGAVDIEADDGARADDEADADGGSDGDGDGDGNADGGSGGHGTPPFPADDPPLPPPTSQSRVAKTVAGALAVAGSLGAAMFGAVSGGSSKAAASKPSSAPSSPPRVASNVDASFTPGIRRASGSLPSGTPSGAPNTSASTPGAGSATGVSSVTGPAGGAGASVGLAGAGGLGTASANSTPHASPFIGPRSPTHARLRAGSIDTDMSSLSLDGSDNYDSDATYDRRAFKAVTVPNASQLAAMKLKPGANVISFEVMAGTFQGAREVSCTLYLWSPHTKVVISDVDGTITKSDILGHIMYFVGRDWTHQGVAALYSSIKKNGYELMYLTSRAIGQTDSTKEYLQNIRQDDDTQLPAGPVITSPDRLLTAFKREVIDRRPQEFKIAALSQISALFPEGVNPFYAGFGNRLTDVMAYRAVGIPDSKIFIINPEGKLGMTNLGYQKSYPALQEIVDEMFPAILPHSGSASGVGHRYGTPTWSDAAFNDSNYWRPTYPALSDDEAEETKSAAP